MGEAARAAAQSGYYRGQMIRQGWENLGQGAQAAYKALTTESEEDKQKAQDELSGLSADGSSLQADLAIKWQETRDSADPNDPNTAQKFIESTVNPAIEKFGSDVTTARGLRERQKAAARIMSHILVTTHADQANLSKLAAVNNVQTTLNGRTRLVDTEPTSWEHAIKEWHHDAENANLPAAERLDIIRQGDHGIAMTSALSMIHKDPAAALEMLEKQSYGNLLSGTEYDSLKEQAKTEREQAIHADNAMKDAERKQMEVKRDGELTDLMLQSAPLNPDTGKFDIKPDFLPKLKATEERYRQAGIPDPDKFRVLRDWAQKEIKGDNHPKVSDHATWTALQDKLTAGTLTLNDVAAASDNLSEDDFKSFYRGAGFTPADKDSQASAQSLVQGMHDMIAGKSGFFGIQDPAGDFRFQLARTALMKTWQKMYDSGLRGDKLDETFQNYLIENQGRLVSKFKAMELGKVLREGAHAERPDLPVWNMGGVEPIQPGESNDAYLKRIGK